MNRQTLFGHLPTPSLRFSLDRWLVLVHGETLFKHGAVQPRALGNLWRSPIIWPKDCFCGLVLGFHQVHGKFLLKMITALAMGLMLAVCGSN